MDIYQLAYRLGATETWFEKDPEQKQQYREYFQIFSEIAIDPDVHSEGLAARRNVILTVSLAFIFLGMMISILFGGALMLLPNVSTTLSTLSLVPSMYLFGTGLWIAALRVLRAQRDIKRFENDPEHFTINHKVLVQWYDYIAVIPLVVYATSIMI